jgi:hypothetical protein
MTTLTDREINHLIATQINGWTHIEDIFYNDSDGVICYLADYCNSIAHSLDLAKTANVGLAPTLNNLWLSYSVANPEVKAEDAVPGKAICLCILKLFGDTQPGPEPEPTV